LSNRKVYFVPCSQVAADVEEAQTNIQGLKDAENAAKGKQQAAKAECVKLEKDMDEFKNNKEGKIEELKVGHPFLLSHFETYPRPSSYRKKYRGRKPHFRNTLSLSRHSKRSIRLRFLS